MSRRVFGRVQVRFHFGLQPFDHALHLGVNLTVDGVHLRGCPDNMHVLRRVIVGQDREFLFGIRQVLDQLRQHRVGIALLNLDKPLFSLQIQEMPNLRLQLSGFGFQLGRFGRRLNCGGSNQILLILRDDGLQPLLKRARRSGQLRPSDPSRRNNGVEGIEVLLT